ncbi:signal peptidase I [Kineococcus endophyticus]|uniref:Signal peptidase I n=1 Tax=Kineococcus endophyticus TaxID=1181883 RepID=A0ABV3P510_9ACTN
MTTSRTRPRTGILAAVREVVLVVAIAVVVSLVVKTFLLQVFWIPSESMEQTLDVGDRVVVSKLTPGPFALHRGDVVVFTDPGDWLAGQPAAPERGRLARALSTVGVLPQDGNDHLVKRLVGLPGDHVVCCDAQGRLSVNGVAVEESGYLAAGARPSQTAFDVTVPAGDLWVMGDNRQDSWDSRKHGFLPEDDVVGRAELVVWPLSHWSRLATPSAFDDVPAASGASWPRTSHRT